MDCCPNGRGKKCTTVAIIWPSDNFGVGRYIILHVAPFRTEDRPPLAITGSFGRQNKRNGHKSIQITRNCTRTSGSANSHQFTYRMGALLHQVIHAPSTQNHRKLQDQGGVCSGCLRRHLPRGPPEMEDRVLPWGFVRDREEDGRPELHLHWRFEVLNRGCWKIHGVVREALRENHKTKRKTKDRWPHQRTAAGIRENERAN